MTITNEARIQANERKGCLEHKDYTIDEESSLAVGFVEGASALKEVLGESNISLFALGSRVP